MVQAQYPGEAGEEEEGEDREEPGGHPNANVQSAGTKSRTSVAHHALKLNVLNAALQCEGNSVHKNFIAINFVEAGRMARLHLFTQNLQILNLFLKTTIYI